MNLIAIATEDEPSEEVATRLVIEKGGAVSMRLRRGGYGYLKSRTKKFAEMARHHPVLMLVDLDQGECPVGLRDDWFRGIEMPERLFFRVVVREIESWLLADRMGLSRYLGVHLNHFPERPDDLVDPKAALLRIAANSSKDIRSDMVARKGSISSQGIGYNARLVEFIRFHWNLSAAADISPSLSRALNRLPRSD